MLNKLKNLFAKKPEVQPEVKPQAESKPKKSKELSPKDKATQAGEPYISIVNLELDPTNINSGSIEFDFNEIFVARLVKAGYMMNKNDTDTDIIDRWWTQVCRQVVLEVYEQQWADPSKRESDLMRPSLNRKDLGDGRSEIS
jgi:hypothetical protein